MMDLRTRIFMGIGLGSIGVILLFLLLSKPWQTVVEEDDVYVEVDNSEYADSIYDDEGVEIPPPTYIGNPNTMSPTLSNEDATERYVRQLAIDFVERFGSYSNQNKNSHIDDVLPLVTESMGAWVETQVLAYSDEYTGGSSHVIVSRIENITEETAIVHIESQQTIEFATKTEKKYNKGRVTLELIADEWKVSGLFWD